MGVQTISSYFSSMNLGGPFTLVTNFQLAKQGCMWRFHECKSQLTQPRSGGQAVHADDRSFTKANVVQGAVYSGTTNPFTEFDFGGNFLYTPPQEKILLPTTTLVYREYLPL